MSKINLYRQLGPIGSGNFGEVIKVERKRDKVRDSDRVTCAETVRNEETQAPSGHGRLRDPQ